MLTSCLCASRRRRWLWGCSHLPRRTLGRASPCCALLQTDLQRVARSASDHGLLRCASGAKL